MQIELNWFNGFYNKRFKDQEEAANFFVNNLDSQLFHCHPLVNTRWCQEQFGVSNPLDLEFDLNGNEWLQLHPIFDPNWYSKVYNSEGAPNFNPYDDFIYIGHKKQNSTHPMVDSILLKKQYINFSYIDLVVFVGNIVMSEQNRKLNKMLIGSMPLLNSKIDWNYLYPSLAWRWM
jgi:hypothetical protein